MLRFLQVNEKKPIPILVAGEALTRGMAVTQDYADNTIKKATATSGFFLVDNAPNYDGLNAVYSPTDGSFETITSGAKALLIPVYVGERYATTELTIGTLTKGASIKSSAGKFVAAVANDVCEWVYGGTYSDPTGLTMYVVECVPSHTVS